MILNIDSNHKRPYSLNVANLPPRKSSPRFTMDTYVSTYPGHSPVNQMASSGTFLQKWQISQLKKKSLNKYQS